MSKKTNSASELKNIPYELFIGALSVLSIFNIFLFYLVPVSDVLGVLFIIDALITLIFLSDFLYRLFTAKSKKNYFLHQFGWADLLASLPFQQTKALRLFRLIRVYKLFNTLGIKKIFSEIVNTRGGSALLTIFLIAILVFEFGGIAILAVEKNAVDATITTSSDALWWIMATVTTVGYGDVYPVTNVGRIVGMIVMITGIGLFGTLTGFLATTFLQPKKSK